MTPRKLLAAFAALSLMGGVAAAPTLAMAQTSAQKALIDAAKADGVVGEQADGYLGFRTATSDSALQSAVTTTNAARRQAYASRAAEAGTETAVAAARMFESQLFARIPTGQWYKNAAGDWVQK